MHVTVALDSDRRRDLEFFSGDDATVDLTVYQHDGDDEPIVVNNCELLHEESCGSRGGSIGLGHSYTAEFHQRERYSIVGYVHGRRTTVAYGLLTRKWDTHRHHGGPPPYQPLFVRNSIDGGRPGSYFEGPCDDGGSVSIGSPCEPVQARQHYFALGYIAAGYIQ
jgi:hypothetical protein